MTDSALDKKWARNIQALVNRGDTLEAALDHQRQGHAHSLTYDAMRDFLDKVVRVLHRA